MNSPTRLCLLHSGTLMAQTWCQAVSAKAIAQGWQVVDPAVETPSLNDQADVLIVTHDPATAAELLPTHWRILICDSSDPDAALPDLAHRSIGLAHLHVWAGEVGAETADGLGTRLQLPGLGGIDWLAGPRTKPADHALALYDRLPMVIGTTAAWPTELFSYPLKGEPTGGRPDMDLTGRFRGLVYGPYFALPPGVWSIEVELAVDPEGSPSPLRFEWGSGDNLVDVNHLFRQAGRYSVTLTQRWTEVGQAELRIWLYQPVFQGRMQFLGAKVTRLPDDAEVTAPMQH